jgi:hypothetical protein
MSLKEIYKRPPIRDLQWVFPFGKFKGLSLNEVMDIDPDYINFLQSKDICDFHDDIFHELEKRNPYLITQAVKRTSRGGYDDDRNSGGGYGIWDDAGCYPGGLFD